VQKIDFDDKDIGIIALCVLAIASLAAMGVEAKDIVVAVVSAIAGLVTGRSLGGRSESTAPP